MLPLDLLPTTSASETTSSAIVREDVGLGSPDGAESVDEDASRVPGTGIGPRTRQGLPAVSMHAELEPV